MWLKIRCDEESEKFCKIFFEPNKALSCPLLLVGPGPGIVQLEFMAGELAATL
jgi:hypothetical protein